MNGVLLTIYLFFGWLSEWHLILNLFARENGPLWLTLFAYKRNRDFGVFQLISTTLIACGMILITKVWPAFYEV